MSRFARRGCFWTAVALAGLLVQGSRAAPPAGQETAKQPPATKTAAGKVMDPAGTQNAEAKPRKKPRGRLPTYFARVVNNKQREEIYAIQQKFEPQIEKLQQQLAELTKQRDNDVTNVLTAEQQAEVAKLRSQRRSRGKTASGTSAAGN